MTQGAVLLSTPLLIPIPASPSQAPQTLQGVHFRTVSTPGISSPKCLFPPQYYTLGALLEGLKETQITRCFKCQPCCYYCSETEACNELQKKTLNDLEITPQSSREKNGHIWLKNDPSWATKKPNLAIQCNRQRGQWGVRGGVAQWVEVFCLDTKVSTAQGTQWKEGAR